MAVSSVMLLFVAIGFLYLGVAYITEGRFVDEFISLTDTLPNTKPTQIVSADGVVLAQLSTDRREPVKFSEVPEYIKNATISAEDHSFWTHPGIDMRGIARAMLANLKHQSVEQGASTITQQLARNAFLNQERTFNRKIREVMIAVHLEKKLSKERIMELYLSRVYYGARAYGIKAGAHVYFGKELKDLTLAEAALLSGLPQRPSVFAPKQGRDNSRAKVRRNSVLQSMLQLGYINQQQYEKAKMEPIRIIARTRNYSQHLAPYFVSYILQQLKEQYQLDFQEMDGWTIQTTLRYDFQVEAENALHATLRGRRFPNEGAVVLIDTDGRILAMVGGSDFKRREFNTIADGHRQPGSSFKPIVYSTAFEEEALSPGSSLANRTMRYPNGKTVGANDHFPESVSAETALVYSINIPAIHALEAAGISRVIYYAQNRFGFNTKNFNPGLALALGSSEVSPLEMAQAYSVFANDGTRVTPYGLASLKGPDGVVNRTFEPIIYPGMLSSRTIDTMNSLLRQVVQRGTAAGASGIHSVMNAHGKTGTTDENRDAWFCGYTDKYVGIVWVAYVTYNKNPKHPVSYNQMPGVFGGNTAAVIWAKMLNSVQAIDKRKTQASEAASMITLRICSDSGLLANSSCPNTSLRKFIRNAVPRVRCNLHSAASNPQGASTPNVSNMTAGENGQPIENPVVLPPPPSYTPPSNTGPPPSSTTDMVTVTVCADTGLRANPYCPEKVQMTFKRGEDPKRFCRRHREGSTY